MDNTPPTLLTAPHRTLDLLTIPDQIPADWSAAFQSARIECIIPADQAAILPESTDPHPADHSELLTWLDKLIKTPARQSVYLGESLKVHIILSLTEPAKVEFNELHHIQTHLQANLSIHVQGNLLLASPTTLHSARSERFGSPGPSPAQNRPKQSSSLDRPQPSIRVPQSPVSTQYESHQLSKPSQLFTASLSHFKPDSSDESVRLDSNHSQKLKHLNNSTHVVIQVAKLANQWLVVWKVDCQMENLQNSTQTGSLALSTVITYHSTRSPNLEPPGSSILSTSLLSDSPPNFNPPSASSRVAGSGFDNAIEIDLFDGMGRDVSVSLTRPLIAPGSPVSAYQNESSHKTSQSNRQGPTSNRFLNSHANLKISSGLANPSRSEDYLPSLPEERRQSAPAVSIPIARRAFSNAYHKESTPIRPTYQENQPRVSDLPFLEKHISLSIPIVDPLILRVVTIAPQHQLKPRELTNEELNYHEIEFIEMEKPFNPMLMLEFCHSGDLITDVDFLIESLDIKLEQDGLLPEFDNFVASTIKIVPIHPTQPPADNLPYRISRNEVHSLIYGVGIESADLLPEQGQPHDSSSLQYGCPPININLPPSTLISNVSSAFKYKKTGIPIVREVHHVSEEESLLGSPALGRAENYIQGGGSTAWGTEKYERSVRVSSLGKSHYPGLDDLSSEVRHSSQIKKAAPVIYSLSINIRGKMVSKDSKIELTGPIAATWTSLLSLLDLSESTTLDLWRQVVKESLGPVTHWAGDEQAERYPSRSPVRDLILPGSCHDDHYNRSVLPRGGLVAGSKRHTASNLMNALQELSTFQKRTSTGGLTLALERSRMQKKQLSPLSIGNDSAFIHQKARADDPSLPDSPPSSVPSAGRRFLPNNRQRTPTATASHPTPQFPERAHQHTEGDLVDYPGSSKTNRPVARGSRLNTPALIGSSFGHPIPTGGTSGAFERGSGSGRGEMMIKVSCSSPTGGDGTNRFKVLQEFAVEILVFNRSSSATTEGPFRVKILTNSNYLGNGNPAKLAGTDGPGRTHPFAPLHDVRSTNGDYDYGNAGAVISLDEAIQIGPLGGGECQAVKIRLIGLKPGIFQLHGIHFASTHNNFPHQYQQQQQQQMRLSQISQFVLVDPLVVLIE